MKTECVQKDNKPPGNKIETKTLVETTSVLSVIILNCNHWIEDIKPRDRLQSTKIKTSQQNNKETIKR